MARAVFPLYVKDIRVYKMEMFQKWTGATSVARETCLSGYLVGLLAPSPPREHQPYVTKQAGSGSHWVLAGVPNNQCGTTTAPASLLKTHLRGQM